jgi:hypothetical protein
LRHDAGEVGKPALSDTRLPQLGTTLQIRFSGGEIAHIQGEGPAIVMSEHLEA